jgi:hypothetical protein
MASAFVVWCNASYATVQLRILKVTHFSVIKLIVISHSHIKYVEYYIII